MRGLFSRDAKAERIVVLLSQDEAEAILEALEDYGRLDPEADPESALDYDVYQKIITVAEKAGWIVEE